MSSIVDNAARALTCAATSFFDLLYPPSCAACGAEGSWWCADCRLAVERITADPCPRCLIIDPSHDRTTCQGSLPFAGVVVTGFYHARPLRKVIGDLKFRGVTAVRGDLAIYLRDVLEQRSAALPWAHEPSLGIQPLPLAAARERDRGFNQSALIADLIAPTWHPNAHAEDSLARISSGTPQANIEDHSLRSANVTGDFVALKRTSHAVLLVDDVVTTGSTSADAARALLGAGATRVYLFALALGA